MHSLNLIRSVLSKYFGGKVYLVGSHVPLPRYWQGFKQNRAQNMCAPPPQTPPPKKKKKKKKSPMDTCTCIYKGNYQDHFASYSSLILVCNYNLWFTNALPLQFSRATMSTQLYVCKIQIGHLINTVCWKYHPYKTCIHSGGKLGGLITSVQNRRQSAWQCDSNQFGVSYIQMNGSDCNWLQSVTFKRMEVTTIDCAQSVTCKWMEVTTIDCSPLHSNEWKWLQLTVHSLLHSNEWKWLRLTAVCYIQTNGSDCDWLQSVTFKRMEMTAIDCKLITGLTVNLHQSRQLIIGVHCSSAE